MNNRLLPLATCGLLAVLVSLGACINDDECLRFSDCAQGYVCQAGRCTPQVDSVDASSEASVDGGVDADARVEAGDGSADAADGSDASDGARDSEASADVDGEVGDGAVDEDAPEAGEQADATLTD